MARFTFRLPDIGEGIAEAEIVAWHVKVGERVEEDQQVADMMTDKATVEMESPVSGVVLELAGEVGDQVAIGSALMVVETDGDGAEAPVSEEIKEQVEAENPGVEEVVEPSPEPTRAPAKAGALEGDQPTSPATLRPTPEHAVEAPREKHVLASPAVRARAKDLGIDLAEVKADGNHVRHADLDAYLRYGQGQGYHAPHASRAREDAPVKVIGMRRRIAENMAASKRAIPHFTYVDEIDVTALEAMRGDLNAHRGNRPKLTMLPFLIVAICRTIPDFPMINARYDDEAGVVTRYGRVHLGMATQTDAGLMVPVIRDAQDKNVWQLAAEITRLAEAARTGKAKSEELSGSTLTVTSLGPLGGIATTPVINRPEVAIIGPNKIVERPIFQGDDIVRAKLMNLSISCDHRVVDGWDAASYVQALRKLLETPVLLFTD
ncbi:2-oxoisovalerate dehydrogenase E2 component (dihydrolipoyl transacylase) [Sphingomonas naasensis]|uniref:Dihydrolipoamide acetyltransferase component of pyruvate dehydrogenase complex n=1 Tax=Sphingomonas naasensis TaxID=1344951 RepID=A0A4S1WBN6_9SPHN|nr:dihydrolipoamide acetyltransferase family protein [Sphingomonas naasensis]NIJ21340.1 2-oxoisovalerate dehydrogenase E2 component (dihydrolipoyl transacylase) [Sphingomonas naasensis]TGX38770.1 2-oxo acid dehydrogenase subunit E2 [Sphingomonas naasensis]